MKYKIKKAKKDDPIYKKGFTISSIKDYFQSKKDRGLKPLFFEKIGDKNSSRDEIYENLIKVLKKNGFKRAVILEWNANTFSVEGLLNGAISICKVPVSVNDKSSLKYFYLNYFVFQ